MTKDEALKEALYLIEAFGRGCDCDDYSMDISKTIDACKEALEQPTQEPVGEVNANGMAWFYSAELAPKYGAKLYTHPRTGNI